MAKPSSKTIEVTVISAEELLVSRWKRPEKNSVSVTVKTGQLHSRSTLVDPEGGSYPEWNEKLVMELPDAARFITVEAYSGRRVIGAASIPVTDFAGGLLPEDYLSLLSYRLWSANGEKNGIVNLSVKVKVIKGDGNNKSGCAATCSRPWVGVPAPDAKVYGAVVTGVPVSYSY